MIYEASAVASRLLSQSPACDVFSPVVQDAQLLVGVPAYTPVHTTLFGYKSNHLRLDLDLSRHPPKCCHSRLL